MSNWAWSGCSWTGKAPGAFMLPGPFAWARGPCVQLMAMLLPLGSSFFSTLGMDS